MQILRSIRNVIFVSLAVLLTVMFLLQVRHTPRLENVKSNYRSSDRAILDRNGLIVDEIRVEKRGRRLNWTELDQVSPAFVEAVLKAEDKRFHSHLGFDPVAMLEHAGANTITMQLVDLIENPLGQPGKHSVGQLWKALVLEIAWNKHDILEAYINLINYRGELQGIAAASFALFDKAPSTLTRSEAAVIAALIRSDDTARVRERACHLLERMGTPEECGLLSAHHLGYIEQSYRIRPYVKMAPHFALKLAEMPEIARGSVIRSTLDRKIQWLAMRALQKPQAQEHEDGGVIVIENATGNVLAYVGNMGANSRASSLDSVTTSHQTGSTLRPLIYAKAIDEHILTSATVLEKSPLSLAHGWVRVRKALAQNSILPAVRALELLGVDTFAQTLTDMGFQSLDGYGPSLALGLAEMPLLDLTNAYRALANGGVWSPLRFSPDKMSEQAPKRVLSAAAAFVVTDILSDYSSNSWTAKSANPDNWCIGFSDKYTVGVWSIAEAQKASSVWQEIMSGLHRQESSHVPAPPEGLTQTAEGWFLTGTEPHAPQLEVKPGLLRSRISYPLNRSLIALDSEISRESHRMFIQIVAPRIDQNLYLNGRRLGRAQAFQSWEPQSGKYKLELRDSQGQVIDKVRFEVRGRAFASAF